MGYIFVDKEDGGSGMGKMREQMRRNMRGGYRYPMMRHGDGDGYEHGYRQGYKHGWEDHEDDMEVDTEYRRRRDSRGRYM